jgi:serine/threonine protein kinase/regulator of sirC expression with transglutaminase-like and TPR domain
MGRVGSSSIWDDTSSPGVALLVRRFATDWKGSTRYRPDPRDYLPEDGKERPAALLALLRADLVLGWHAHERCTIESYRDRYPELDPDSLVALLYEEYCLREEAGESPRAEEYQFRFPELAKSFQEVVEIHDLVGRARAALSRPTRPSGVPLPEVGETIAGFRLVEELGQGSFARVYLAEEQHLSDRQVALKVARTGSREPQTLARFQHTHIVPVYSSRTDPATGLHLLCMPYLGRVTLLQILNQPEIGCARTGADLLGLLYRLEPHDGRSVATTAGRAPLETLSYPRAIAWWAARLAEALQHAHARGVLHRDVKPSNILVTADGLPMLLDFNLSREPQIEGGVSPEAVAGTLNYMAPERLEAIALGKPDPVEAGSDLYALGVVLVDCLARAPNSFAFPMSKMPVGPTLLKAAETRRAEPPRLRAANPDVPAALEAVVSRCLAAEPRERYASAAELAADLQAVADDRPLQFAREPFLSRVARFVRGHRRSLALGAAICGALAVTAYAVHDAQLSALRLDAEVIDEGQQGRRSAEGGQFDLAASHFDTAARLASGQGTARALEKAARFREEAGVARETKRIRDQADLLFAQGERLRSSILGAGDDFPRARKAAESALKPFSILDKSNWQRRRPIELLDDARRERLTGEVNDLLFLFVWVVAFDRDRQDDRDAIREAIRLCDWALAFARPVGPWQALRARCRAILSGEARQLQPQTVDLAEVQRSARGCFQWAFLCDLDGRTLAAIDWLERARVANENDYWTHFYLGFYLRRIKRREDAIAEYGAAVALRPDSPWARYNRALVYQERGDWRLALEDLKAAQASPQAAYMLDALNNALAVVKHALGDDAGAREAADAVIARGAGRPLALAARLHRAQLDIDAGAPERAWAEYEALLADNPRDVEARKNRALLAHRLGKPAQAETDLTTLLSLAPEQAETILARRALARLALGWYEGAQDDAAGAYRRRPSGSRQRLWVRTLLALHRVEELLWLEQPDDLAELPRGGLALTADLRAALERLASHTGARGVAAPPALRSRTRAVLLSALNDRAALGEAGRAIALAPDSAEGYLVRARIQRRFGDLRAAMADVESGLALAPGDPRVLELRGILKTETGNATAGLNDLDRAILGGAPAQAHLARASALMALGRNHEALREWSIALESDPDDPDAYLGRASSFLRLEKCESALVDLELAADRAGDNPVLLSRIALLYARGLALRPDRFSRWLLHARRAFSALIASGRTSLKKR